MSLTIMITLTGCGVGTFLFFFFKIIFSSFSRIVKYSLPNASLFGNHQAYACTVL